MRKSLIAGLTFSAAMTALAGQSHAYVNYPWCVTGETRGYSCHFTTREQCAQDGRNRGFGGTCIRNPYYDPTRGPVIETRPDRHSDSGPYDDPHPAFAMASAKDRASARQARDAHRQQPSRVVETPKPLFRIPAHPVVRDCVHVFFPQCGRGFDGLNDGTFGKY